MFKTPYNNEYNVRYCIEAYYNAKYTLGRPRPYWRIELHNVVSVSNTILIGLVSIVDLVQEGIPEEPLQAPRD